MSNDVAPTWGVTDRTRGPTDDTSASAGRATTSPVSNDSHRLVIDPPVLWLGPSRPEAEIRLHNDADRPVTLGGLRFEGANWDVFRVVDHETAETLAPGGAGSVTIAVSLSALTATNDSFREASARLRFSADHNDYELPVRFDAAHRRGDTRPTQLLIGLPLAVIIAVWMWLLRSTPELRGLGRGQFIGVSLLLAMAGFLTPVGTFVCFDLAPLEIRPELRQQCIDGFGGVMLRSVADSAAIVAAWLLAALASIVVGSTATDPSEAAHGHSTSTPSPPRAPARIGNAQDVRSWLALGGGLSLLAIVDEGFRIGDPALYPLTIVGAVLVTRGFRHRRCDPTSWLALTLVVMQTASMADALATTISSMVLWLALSRHALVRDNSTKTAWWWRAIALLAMTLAIAVGQSHWALDATAFLQSMLWLASATSLCLTLPLPRVV